MLRRVGAQQAALLLTVRASVMSPYLRFAALSACSLCDTETDDWHKHCALPQHQARLAVCAALVSPERHEVVMKQLWEHIQLDFSNIDDANDARIAKRRTRLRSTVAYLKQVDILTASLVYAEPQGLCVQPRFSQFALLGESQLAMEVADRVARLLPKTLGPDLANIVSFILCQRHLVQMYDGIGMECLVQDSLKLTAEQKAAVFLSVYGELAEYSRRRHSHDVANKAAADRLVGNVLASHALENFASELVHTILQKIVDEGTPVWLSFKAESAERFKKGVALSAAVTPLSRTPAPSPPPSTAGGDGATVLASCKWLHTLAPAGKPSSASPMRTKVTWTDLTRVSTLEITVPNPVSKSAFYASIVPKLAAKPKNPPK